MNILEVSFLVADVVIFFGAVASYQGFLRLKKKVDILQTKMDSFQDNIYHLQTYQRHELKFELDDIKNQQERSQVTISKLGIDLESLSKNEMFVKESKYYNLFDMVYNLTLEKSKSTKPTDSVKNELVKIIQDNPTNEPPTPTKKKGRPSKTPIYNQAKKEAKVVMEQVVKEKEKKGKKEKVESEINLRRELEGVGIGVGIGIGWKEKEGGGEGEVGAEAGGAEFSLIRRKVKADVKRVIRTRELEKYFKEVTKLTYRGYVLKHGIGEFQSMKMKIYKRLYFQKFTKPKQEEQKLTEQKQVFLDLHRTKAID